MFPLTCLGLVPPDRVKVHLDHSDSGQGDWFHILALAPVLL